MRIFIKNQYFVKIFALLWVSTSLLFLEACHQKIKSYELLDGSEVSIPNSKGWTLVNYWAAWCDPCLKEIPQLNELSQKLPAPLVAVVGIYFDPIDEVDLRSFIKKIDVKYRVFKPNMGSLPVPVPQMLPANYLVNSEGKIFGPLLGPQTKQSILEEIRKYSHNNSSDQM